MSEYDDKNELFFGLKALSESNFPKRCACCGAVFKNSEDFFTQTKEISNKSGLKNTEDDNGHTIVEVFRNCHCGSTLMDEFQNRRDESETGIIRREKFDKILVILMNKGIPKEKGRLEILGFMRGERGTIIDEMLPPKK